MKGKMNQNEFYSTQDYPTATTLLCLGHPVVELNRNDSSRFSFVFECNEDLERIVKLFWQKKIRVEPMGFIQAQKEIKSRIYSQS